MPDIPRTPAAASVALASWMLLASFPALVHAQADSASSSYRHDQAPQLRVARTTGVMRIDGLLDEPGWSAAEACTVFTQLDPEEGKPVSERTEVRVLVGEDALYVGARLYDREAARIKARLARRDDPVESDEFLVALDSYHDHLTARRFRVNPAGAIYDAAVGASGDEDASWDAVWEAIARVDGSGWTAELRIPFSQLRYNPQDDATWGMQLTRVIFRKGEFAYSAFTPKKEQGGVSRFGHLVGLGRLPRSRHLELLPYTAARNEHLDFPDDHPFRSSSDFFGAAGLDLKYGMTSDLTLDLAVNPDFGQVEVDPAEVNLTAFETFFPEKRSFFIEGADLFSFGRSRAFNNFGVPTIFHSRRIGRAPQRTLGGPNFDFVDVPEQTTIAGAAKLTGRTRGGWAIGVLDAVTTNEDARFVDSAGSERETLVEPLTHYFAGRVRRDFRAGNTSLGGLFTAVNRRLDDPGVRDLLRSDAYIGGLDLAHAWGNRQWAFDAAVTVATIIGTPDAIVLAQRSSTRYYQRPDHDDYAVYDPTRTNLDGHGLDASISKTAGTHWQYSLAYVSRSPGYEANDLGFQTRADMRGLSSIVLYSENRPGRWFRNYTVFPYVNQMWNFGNDRVYDSYAFSGNGLLENFWPVNASVTLNRSVVDDRMTRGGPQGRSPENGNWSAGIGSDTRRSWSINANYSHAWNEAGGWGEFPSVSVSLRPAPTLRLRFQPSYTATHALAQYLMTVPDPAATATFGSRYVFASLDQRIMSLVTRVDWTLTPRLSFQLYLQPLVVTGDYSTFKEYHAPGTFEFDVYGRDRGTITRDTTGLYTVDPGNGSTFIFGDPDFNFRSLLGNAVVRWEYRPGSTLFFVWQQSRTDVQPFGDFDFGRDYRELLDHSPENVFAVKATYWIGL
jgi:uncharacterized protein DUF5916/cellulose/xylan binding protein with CBM9 domain